jgi:PAS domain S-box-containing protein
MRAPIILIVDDNPANLKVARIALEGEGFAIRTAVDGHAAVDAIARERPDLILMDIQLPGIDGLELTRRLKGDPATAGIPIVAVTAYAMKGDREKALAVGCDDYLTKPIDPIELPTIVRGLVREPVAPEAATTTPAGAGQALILVVEDNPATRKTLRLSLESDGHLVVEAPDARTAMRLADERTPDLVLQDLCLPDLDGIELVHRLRAQPRLADVPILCITGFLTRFDETRATQGGFTGLLVKPIDPIELSATVRGHLERRAAPVDAVSGGRRVLLVDDNGPQRRLTQLILQRAGFAVTAAADGVQALAAARAAQPDIIVSDVLMPELDGFELCLAVRQDPALATVPVVLLSSHYVEELDRSLARRVGASHLLARTPELHGLTEAVAAALAAPVPAADRHADAVRKEHDRRVLWQLERQVEQNAGLAQRCSIQAAQLAVLAGTAEALSGNRPLGAALDDVLAACLDMAGVSKGALYQLGRGGLRLTACVGFADNERAEVEGCFGQYAMLAAASHGHGIRIPPAPRDPSTGQLLVRMGVTSALVVPVTWGSHVTGVLVLGARSQDLSPDESLAFARVLGVQLAQAISLGQTFERVVKAEQRYRALMEGATDLVTVLTTDGVVIEMNRRWEDVLQLPREQLVGRQLTELTPQDDAAALAAYRTSLTRGGDAAIRLRRGDGTEVAVELSSVLIDVDNETVVLTIGRDVTEKMRAQSQLMVSDRMASLGMLAAGVAHEINNPLAAVIMNLELALREVTRATQPGPSSALGEELSDAREAAARVRNIVRDLRMFSHSERDEVGPVAIHDVFDSVTRMAANEIRHRARLRTAYQTVPPVHANSSRLGQVFLNLVMNAAQAIDEGHAESNEIVLSTSLDDAGRVLVEVSDTGSGIAPEVMRRLFTPFVTTKPVGVGTGLGLSICQRIVEQIGGEISVHSVVGAGTTVRVRLPVSASLPPPATIASPVLASSHRRGRILAIDDEAIIARSIRRICAGEHEVVALTRAAEAVALIQQGERFDVILCDLMMPQMTGMDLHAAIAAIDAGQAQRMIFMTGGAFTPRAQTFLEGIENLRIEKPFDPQQLRAVVNARVN